MGGLQHMMNMNRMELPAELFALQEPRPLHEDARVKAAAQGTKDRDDAIQRDPCDAQAISEHRKHTKALVTEYKAVIERTLKDEAVMATGRKVAEPSMCEDM